MITQKDLEQLALLKTEAEKASLVMENFQQDVAEAVTEIAFRHYPLLKEMESEHIQQFGDGLSRISWELAIHIDHVASKVS